jgi:hypothetical protein
MGHYLADQRYGLNSNSNFEQGTFYHNNDIPGLSSNLVALENFDPNFSSDPFHWIPKGLIEDLMDNTPTETLVNDQVNGYTIQQIFSVLQSDVTNPSNIEG